ncbi:MAG TPA: hypothetical protein VK784_06680 [Pseudonocardiaceae bacterium]|jgi:hypothetical protein|nr:hypothetical protein [Pseudonocardiaceae bacterium]
MVCIGHWVTLPNGNKVCIQSKGSAIAVALTAVLVTSGLAAGGLAATAAVGSIDSVVGQSIETRTTNGKESARRGQYDETWKRLRLRPLRQTLKQINREFQCALRSTGQVQQFFVREPCRSLQRTLIPLADADGYTIVVAIAWVRMFNSSSAIRLADLIDTAGTGGIQPLAGAPLGYDGIQFTGQHYAVRRSGDLEAYSAILIDV